MYRLLTLKIRLCTVFSVLKTTLVQVRHRISSSIRETNLKGPLTTLSNIPTLPEGNHLQLSWQSNLLQSEGSLIHGDFHCSLTRRLCHADEPEKGRNSCP